MTTKNVSNNTLRENNKSYEKHNKNNNINFKNIKAENNKKENNNNYKRNKIPTYNIKIGERNFCLTSESLNRDAPNFFTAAFFGYFSEAKTTSIFIERDPTYFAMIVRYLRGYEVDWPINDKISMNNLLTDVKFYCFGNLQNYLEDIYEKKFPERVIPWKIVTYVPEDHPVVVINIKDVELERWNSRSLVYDTNPISKKQSINEKNDNDNNDEEEEEENDDDGNASDNEDNAANDENNENNDANDNDVADNNNDNDNNENATDDNDLVEPNADKGLYRLEIHGKDATATVTSNHNNGIKFENFTLKNSAEEETFRALTEPFRTSEGSLTLSPSLKLPFLKDSCIEIDGSKYYTYKELSSYFGVTSGDKKLYFEEMVLRIDDGAFLMRARALTIPFYYASQPFQS